MSIRLATTTLVALLVVYAVPALAIDPAVYRECMARCRSFSGRTCCHESCSYEACIANSIKTSFGHGTRRGGLRLDQIDPGAWSGAMAACYPWISILKDCGGGQPGRPPVGASAPLALTQRPAGTAAARGPVVLRRVGKPIADPIDVNWVLVQPGSIVNKGYQYRGTYSWSEPPQEITDRGFPIELTVKAETEGKQRMATGIGINGDFDFVRSPSDLTKAETSFPANSEGGRNDTKTVSVHVLPRRSYSPNAKVALKIGAFWGRSVTYVYEPVAR